MAVLNILYIPLGSENWKTKKVLMFCVAPPELETKMNITKGGLVLFSANSNSSCMELSKKIAEWVIIIPLNLYFLCDVLNLIIGLALIVTLGSRTFIVNLHVAYILRAYLFVNCHNSCTSIQQTFIECLMSAIDCVWCYISVELDEYKEPWHVYYIKIVYRF